MGIIDRLRTDPGLWKEITADGTPVVEPWDDDHVLVTFLWRGEATGTRVCWGVWADLTRLPGTDIWHVSRVMPADTRTVYYLAHGDGDAMPRDLSGAGAAHIDPGNPRRQHFPADPLDPTDHDVWASVLELPAAPPEPWTGSRPGVTPGTRETHTLHSAALGGDRHIVLHRPAGVPATGLPSLVVFDGHNSREVLRVPETLDNLVAAGRIPACTAIFVHLPDATRDDELGAVPALRDFIASEVMPFARTTWGTPDTGGRNVVAGASRGGLAAAYLALELPELFGAAICQSGSFWWGPDGEPEWLTRQVTARPPVDVRFYLDVGAAETTPGPNGLTQIDVNRRMRDALLARGYDLHYAEYAGSHDYVNWRRTFADGLLAVRRPAG
ncbi:alpha/beta hydrolase-fold protein [Actinoplanes subglobosus]|uniref:Alpha/beta hydrolase-fold protein n=1 Tax=Actinoplanes subglobosus TaxID=1547892 RepID=A0ABV8IYA3_9ACTN